MSRVLVPLAEGCEELEAVTVIDLLRRAGIEVVTAGLARGPIRASRGTVLLPDVLLEEVLHQDFDMVALPGGGPGAERLAEDERVRSVIHEMAEAGKYTAAICAAPKVLADAGVLAGKQATSYPGILEEAAPEGVTLKQDPVVVDGSVVTSRGPGTAMDFALTLVELLAGRPRRDEVEAALQRP
jgi:4-methyl-5(b-hydroxyethyl)-thiazole monophosphate biosynthesis